jgi:hypothetical protein
LAAAEGRATAPGGRLQGQVERAIGLGVADAAAADAATAAAATAAAATAAETSTTETSTTETSDTGTDAGTDAGTDTRCRRVVCRGRENGAVGRVGRQLDNLDPVDRVPIIAAAVVLEGAHSRLRPAGDAFVVVVVVVIAAVIAAVVAAVVVAPYPRAVVLGGFHHEGATRAAVGVMGREYGATRAAGGVNAHGRRVQGYGLLPAAVRRARDLRPDDARRVLDNLRVGWQSDPAQYTARIAT